MTGLDWTFTAIWLVLWAGGLALLAWALFAGRAKGRPRCDRCRYSLTGLDLPATTAEPPIPCPECGRPIRSLKQALRTRRRPIVAAFAALMILAAPVVWRVPEAIRAQQAGQFRPLNLMPAPVLLAAIASMPSSAWAYEARSRFIEGQDLASAFGRLLAPQFAQTRDRWPTGTAIAIYTQDFRIAYAGELPRLTALSDSRIESHAVPRDVVGVWLPPPAPGRHSLRFEYHTHSGEDVPPKVFYRSIEVVGEMADYLRPISGRAVDDRVLAGILARLVLGPGLPRESIMIEIELTTSEWYSRGLTASLARDRQPMPAHADMVRTQGGYVAILNGGCVPRLRQAIESGDDDEVARWSITLTGDPHMALADIHATAYWSGTLSIPVRTALDR